MRVFLNCNCICLDLNSVLLQLISLCSFFFVVALSIDELISQRFKCIWILFGLLLLLFVLKVFVSSLACFLVVVVFLFICLHRCAVAMSSLRISLTLSVSLYRSLTPTQPLHRWRFLLAFVVIFLRINSRLLSVDWLTWVSFFRHAIVVVVVVVVVVVSSCCREEFEANSQTKTKEIQN